MESIVPLFQNNFAPSVNNSFLVQDCSEVFGGCVIPASNFETCDKKSGNISCYSKQDGVDVVAYKDLNETKCKYLFSAVSFGQSNETLLQFQVVELAWWLYGHCDECSDNATCTQVPPKGGFRCQCIHGFTGDGFRSGTGCRKSEFTLYIIIYLSVYWFYYFINYYYMVWFLFLEKLWGLTENLTPGCGFMCWTTMWQDPNFDPSEPNTHLLELLWSLVYITQHNYRETAFFFFVHIIIAESMQIFFLICLVIIT